MNQSQRSELMKRIKSRDTSLELEVRRALHSLGFRYRLYRRDLPGNPDLTFSTSRKVIFINGCFWHGHKCVAGQNKPKTNLEYWIPKLRNNGIRDRRNYRRLRALGWNVMVLWECEISKNQDWLRDTVKFLGR